MSNKPLLTEANKIPWGIIAEVSQVTLTETRSFMRSKETWQPWSILGIKVKLPWIKWQKSSIPILEPGKSKVKVLRYQASQMWPLSRPCSHKQCVITQWTTRTVGGEERCRGDEVIEIHSVVLGAIRETFTCGLVRAVVCCIKYLISIWGFYPGSDHSSSQIKDTQLLYL